MLCIFEFFKDMHIGLLLLAHNFAAYYKWMHQVGS